MNREVARELARLREEIAALRTAKTSCCHGCGCVHWYYTPTWTYPAAINPTYTVTTSTSGGMISYSQP